MNKRSLHWPDASRLHSGFRRRLDPCVRLPHLHERRGRLSSPADDYSTKATDLNAALIKNPQATFLMRIAGSSMRDAGIDDGDVVLVDRALRPRHGSIIIAIVDRDFTCKRLYRRGSVLKLQAANPTYPDFVPSDGQTMELWGVVTKVISRS